MRRRALTLPQALCDRLAAAGDPLEVKAILDEAVRELLSEVADLPNCVDPAEWEKFLADQSENRRAPGTGEKARDGARASPKAK